MRDIAAEGADFLDETRRDELEAVGRHQKDGFDLRVQPGVHTGHLELVFEIGNRAQPADDDLGPDRLGKTHQQRVEGEHLDPFGVTVFEVGDLVTDDLNPLVCGEQRTLAVVAGDADDQSVHNPGGPADNVRMAVGDRVEGAGIDPDARLGHASPSLACSLSGASSGSSAPPFSSDSSGSRATETTRSPSPTLKITTPALPR